MKAEGYEATGKGSLPRPSISVSNLLGTFTALISLLPNNITDQKILFVDLCAQSKSLVDLSGFTVKLKLKVSSSNNSSVETSE